VLKAASARTIRRMRFMVTSVGWRRVWRRVADNSNI